MAHWEALLLHSSRVPSSSIAWVIHEPPNVLLVCMGFLWAIAKNLLVFELVILIASGWECVYVHGAQSVGISA